MNRSILTSSTENSMAQVTSNFPNSIRMENSGSDIKRNKGATLLFMCSKYIDNS